MNQDIKDAVNRATAYLDELVQDGQIPGIQYMVVRADSILLAYAGGLRDSSCPDDKVEKNTSFLSSSTTKVLTAAAVLKLLEAGKVSLDDPLSKFYKDHPYGDDLQIQHLINQSSGIPNPMPLKWLHTTEEHSSYSETDAIETALKENSKLNFKPGEKYAYSNLSYWLLGKVIEEASGMSYRQYMRDQVFDPLNISESELDTEIHDPKLYARGHVARYSLFTFVFWLLIPSRLWDKSAGNWARFKALYMNGPPYGGVVGTASGYAKFLQDMLKQEPTLFSPETKALFFKDQHDSSGTLMPTTLGWHRGKLGDQIYYTKPGGGPGYHSNIRIYPEAGIASIYLCNKAEASEAPINAFSNSIDAEFLRK
jgi:D-alanyl-D-alanine carboxypeptidase